MLAICNKPLEASGRFMGGNVRRRVQGSRGGTQTWRKHAQASQCPLSGGRWRCLPQTNWSTQVPVPGVQTFSRNFSLAHQTSLICFVCCFRPH